METHVCVLQTVRSLLELGYEVFLVGDAVSSRTKHNYRNALTLMHDMGAVITNTETVFFDLMKRSDTPEFKELSSKYIYILPCNLLRRSSYFYSIVFRR